MRTLRRRGVPEPAVLATLATLAIVAVLVAKPWTSAGEAGSMAASAAPGGASSPTAVASIAPIHVIAPLSSPSASATPSVESSGPIDPATWARICASLRGIDAYGVAIVVRSEAQGEALVWRFAPVTPGERPSPIDTVHLDGSQAWPVAFGFAWPANAPPPGIRAWQVFGPGAAAPLGARSPLGDLDQRLLLGPTNAMPLGERRNGRETSAWPASWGPGVYRFDLETADGVRSVFVALT